MNRKLIPVALVAATFAMSACAEKKLDEMTGKDQAGGSAAVAVVNGEEISKDVWDLWVKMRTRGMSPDELTPEQTTENLDQLIQVYVAGQEARKEGLTKGESGARIELMQQTALADLLSQKFQEGQEPTPEEKRAEYDKQVALLPKLEYKARHILVADEAKARELIASLDSGARFETLAEQNSTDSSAKEGGDLGWFVSGRMVKPFADAVEALEKGTYTKEPVQSQFGWHVIKLEDTRPLTPPAFEEVEAQIGPMVQQSKFQAYLEELTKTAKIERKL
jgi:peptidyl-prolyl cis-trans isomerase C